jgi:hypothetical protein
MLGAISTVPWTAARPRQRGQRVRPLEIVLIALFISQSLTDKREKPLGSKKFRALKAVAPPLILASHPGIC